MRRLVLNSAQCNLCGDIVTSETRHDNQWCSCRNLGVDGGLEYVRRSYLSPSTFTELSVYEEEQHE